MKWSYDMPEGEKSFGCRRYMSPSWKFIIPISVFAGSEKSGNKDTFSTPTKPEFTYLATESFFVTFREAKL